VYDKGADSDRLISALKAALKARRVTMRQLSDSLHIPYRSLQNYLSGESRLPADVLLSICQEIGLEADYLAKGNFELSHFDLYDAVLNPASKAEVLSAAHVLTVQLNEAYAGLREHSLKTGVVRPVTSTRHEARRRKRPPSEVGQ
jgi:transcriptional regulator with XRE-family HTH domain